MRAWRILAWVAVVLAIAVPFAIAARSPLLEWRSPVYVAGGFAGILGLGLLLVQPLVIGGALVRGPSSRRIHGWLGAALVVAVLVHVAGLWITSPPDVIDVLLFRSPTPFGLWGAVAMWAVFGAALIAVLRRRIGPRTFRDGHAILTALAVLGTAVHAVLIEGAMGQVSKAVLCALALAATAWAMRARRVRGLARPSGS